MEIFGQSHFIEWDPGRLVKYALERGIMLGQVVSKIWDKYVINFFRPTQASQKSGNHHIGCNFLLAQ